MANEDVNLADRSGNLVESHKGYDSRVVFFYFVIAALVLLLAGGLAWEQLVRSAFRTAAEEHQNRRRVIIPGPRGRILDREGRVLVGSEPRLSVVLYVDGLQDEFIREMRIIRKNYREAGDKDAPSLDGFTRIARYTVVQRYLDQVNAILHSTYQIDSGDLEKYFAQQTLVLPYTLITDLSKADFAQLTERLPVRSPLQVYTSNVRTYPYKSAAAHTLGYLSANPNINAEDFPGDKFQTFKLKGTIGKDGLERWFDEKLQGEVGGAIYLVNKDGYRVNKPLAQRFPRPGQDLVTSLDIDLQQVAEQSIAAEDTGEGAAVVLDVHTGEVLVMASKPDYDLNQFSPRITREVVQQIEATHAWDNRAMNGLYAPGSTFKILVSIAGMRAGTIPINQPIVDCEGVTKIGGSVFVCENRRGIHGEILLPEAIAHSCDIFFYEAGLRTTARTIVDEAHRFGLGLATGIELPGETKAAVIPDDAWAARHTEHKHMYPGDIANMSIGQGWVLVTPLQMACFAASVARNETTTKPTLIHDANRPPLHTEPIGLTREQRIALLQGMEGVITHGTAAPVASLDDYKLPVPTAGKTGTAQVGPKGHQINIAWFICFAPIDNPEIAMAVTVKGDTVGETFEGGRHGFPAAAKILRAYFEKKAHPTTSPLLLQLKTPAQ